MVAGDLVHPDHIFEILCGLFYDGEQSDFVQEPTYLFRELLTNFSLPGFQNLSILQFDLQSSKP